MDTIKLTKNEIRFSASIRPEVGTTIEFSPVKLLCSSNYTIPSLNHSFNKNYIVPGAKCVVIENKENVVRVYFVGHQDEDWLVSPDFLTSRELTDGAIEALNVLKENLLIN